MYLYAILLVLFLIVSVLLIAFILMQQGKGASMGASFGAGASNTLFGSAGSADFFVKSTWILGALEFILAIILGYMTSHRTSENTDDFTNIEQPAIVKTEMSDAVDSAKAQASEAVDAVKENTAAAVDAG